MLGQISAVARCARPMDGEFISVPCQPGNPRILGENTTIGRCAETIAEDLPEGAKATHMGDLVFSEAADSPCVGLCELTVTGSVRVINSQLSELGQLSCLSEIGEHLVVADNDELTRVDGLSRLHTVIGDIDVSGNARLCDAHVWAVIDALPGGVGGLVAVEDNSRFCDFDDDGVRSDADCDDTDPSVSQVGFYSGNLVIGRDDSGFCDGYCQRDVSGDIIVTNAGVNQIPALPCIQSVGRDLVITGAPDLQTVGEGLKGLKRVSRNIRVEGNPRLTAIDGLNALKPSGAAFVSTPTQPSLASAALMLSRISMKVYPSKIILNFCALTASGARPTSVLISISSLMNASR